MTVLSRIALRSSLLLAFLVLMSGLSAAHAANQTIADAVDGFIRPAYREFAAKTHEMVPVVSALCKAHGPKEFDAARASFGNVVEAWSEIETVRIGPVTQDNRQERILHWPDRKSIGLKQVQAALSNEDATATDATRLAGKSVAMQGLGALEFLLFGTGADDPAAWTSGYRCRYAEAISENLSNMAGDISREWEAADGFASTWENPGSANALYRNDDESLTDLMDILVQGTEMVRDVRLNGFLGENADDDKPKQAIYWRSNGTVDSLAANMEGIAKLFAASHLAELATGDNAYLGSSIDFEFGNVRTALSALKGKPLDTILPDKDARSKLSYFGVVTSSLSDLFGTRLSGALNLTAGFSSLDGD
ncbi:MAG: peptidase M75, Imelysin [Rhizobiaceae bacterium]|nr:peptidase M75, Imelysin [Rhizobiaceae bacterium]